MNACVMPNVIVLYAPTWGVCLLLALACIVILVVSVAEGSDDDKGR